jgi:phosphatidylglycerol lysyltransferase
MHNLRRNLEGISVQGVAVLTAAMGIVNVLSAVKPSLIVRLRLLEAYLPFRVSHEGHLASALAGFALLVLSRSLWRRKQVGWFLTLGILLLSIIVHLLKGLDYEEAGLAALLGLLLLYLRPHFQARSDEPSLRQGLQLLAASLLFTLSYGVLGFYLLDRHYSVNFGFWAAVRQSLVMFTQFYDPGLQPLTGFGRYFADSIYVVGASTLGYALFMLLRPVLVHTHAREEERKRAAEIVGNYGRSSLARYALLPDKLYFFSPGGSVIPYVQESHMALALGDPIGPPEDLPNALADFQKLCASNDWQPVFYQVLPDHLEAYRSAGLDSLPVGNEAMLDLAKFTLEGSENKNVRNAYSKMTRGGYRYEVIQPPHSPRMLRELNEISDDWLASRGMSEMRFSMGWFDEAYLNTCPILLVRDREGFIDAFANIVTGFNPGGAAVDLMRHHHYSEKGIMDFLFVSLFEWAKGQGCTAFDLGLSAFSGIGENVGDPAMERALNYVYENLNRFYNFKGLHAFKEKFHPEWSPRYLVYPGMSSLPAVIPALLRANSGGGGFLGLQK